MLQNVRPLSSKLRWLLLAIVVLGSFQVVEHLISESSLISVFRYERDLIEGGDYYRLITAHLVHLNWTHFGLNVLGLAACCVLLDGSVKGLTVSLLAGMAVISTGLFMLYPQVQWYAGYSGVLYGQVLFGLLTGIDIELRRAGRAMSPGGIVRLCLLVVGALYLLFRVIASLWTPADSAASETLIGAPVLHEAHLLGSIAGVLAFVLLSLRKSSQT